jgi:hypothetical protein
LTGCSNSMMVAIMVGLHAQDNSVLGMILFLRFFVNLIHPTAAKILTVAPRSGHGPKAELKRQPWS